MYDNIRIRTLMIQPIPLPCRKAYNILIAVALISGYIIKYICKSTWQFNLPYSFIESNIEIGKLYNYLISIGQSL
jgi:hypothetical protein